MKKEDTQVTLNSEQTDVSIEEDSKDKSQQNYLEEYELINDSFQDDSPE